MLLVAESWNGTTKVKTVTRLDGSGGRVDTPIELGTRIELIGQDGAAYLNRMSGINNSVEKKVVDVRNFTTRYTVPPEWSWLAASPDGGARVEGTDGQLATFDGIGQLISTSASVDITGPVHEFGDLVGRNFLTGVRAVATPFDDATVWDQSYRRAGPSTEEPRSFGNRQATLAPRVPRLAHFVVPPELAIPGSGDPYLPNQYKTDVTGDFQAGRLQAIPTFFNVEDATAERFLKEADSGNDAVAFIGHSVLIPERPE
jgi:hypothetical protein